MGLVSALLKGTAKGVVKAAPVAGRAFAKSPAWLAKSAGAVGLTAVSVGLVEGVGVPAMERVTGRDFHLGGLDLGTLTQEAVSGSAQGVGSILGSAETGFSRGFGEGALRGLFPELSSEDAKQFVTIGILGIGAVLLLSVLKK